MYPERLQPLLVWTEIFSCIKGSEESSDYVKLHLPLDAYLRRE
jgi:hypothetical protein